MRGKVFADYFVMASKFLGACHKNACSKGQWGELVALFHLSRWILSWQRCPWLSFTRYDPGLVLSVSIVIYDGHRQEMDVCAWCDVMWCDVTWHSLVMAPLLYGLLVCVGPTVQELQLTWCWPRLGCGNGNGQETTTAATWTALTNRFDSQLPLTGHG